MLKFLSVIALISCVFATVMADNTDGVDPFVVPEAYRDLLKDYRRNWNRMTGFEYSGLHWRQFIAVYMNKNPEVYVHNYFQYMHFFQDLDDEGDDMETVESEPKFHTYQAGTIVLKENFVANNGAPGQALTITMMIKRRAGYDTKNGDWEYVQFTRDGQVILSGRADEPVVKAACGDCHKNMASRDYIFSQFYSHGQ